MRGGKLSLRTSFLFKVFLIFLFIAGISTHRDTTAQAERQTTHRSSSKTNQHRQMWIVLRLKKNKMKKLLMSRYSCCYKVTIDAISNLERLPSTLPCSHWQSHAIVGWHLAHIQHHWLNNWHQARQCHRPLHKVQLYKVLIGQHFIHFSISEIVPWPTQP